MHIPLRADKRFIVNAARRYLRTGLKRPLQRLLGLPMTRLHSDWEILAPIGPNYKPHCIIDVGANTGWFFHCWLDWCPNARVHAFEPYLPSFEAALRNYGDDCRVKLTQMAVGDTCGQQTMHVLTESLVSNSLLKPRDETWEEVRYQMGNVVRNSVKVIALDDYASTEAVSQVYLLKIDVQGYEMHVLKGADAILQRTDHIFVESGIRPLYKDAPHFCDVFEHLTARGFHLMAMQAWHRGNHVLMEADMLFRRNDLMPPVDETVVRVIDRVG